MPLISIKSLPLVECGDMEDLLAGMSQELADATGIDRRHITMTWEYLRPRHYSEGGETRDRQPEDSHPILVSVLAPDFHRPEKVEAMMKCVATGIAARVPVNRENVFVHFAEAHSGKVFDGGKIVRW